MRARSLLALLLAALLPSASGAQSAMTSIRIATTPIDSAAEPYYAAANGTFAHAGLNAEVQSISNGPAVAAAVASGAVDLGVGSVVPLALAHERGIPFVILFPAGVYAPSAPTTVLMVPNDSPIKSARDLDGKTVAVQALQSIAQLAPEAWIDEHGGDSKSVHFLEISAAASPAALESHRVDASLVPEPLIAKAKASSRVLTDIYAGLRPGFAITVWFTTRAWADAHPDAVAKLLRAFHETAVWANTHQRESGLILEQNSKVNEADLSRMARSRYGERMDPRAIQPSIDLAARYGLLAHGFPASEFIYVPH